MARKLHKVPEAAYELNLSSKTVWKMIYAGELTCTRIGRSVRIPEEAIQELIDGGTIPARIS
jgi:excisionase family DNA binding protein